MDNLEGKKSGCKENFSGGGRIEGMDGVEGE